MNTIAIDARKISDFGIGSYLRGLVGALQPILEGEELVLLGDRQASEGADGQEAEAIPELRWVDERSPLYSARELWSVGSSARRAGADLLHVPHYTMPVGAAMPVVVTIHDLIHLRFPGDRTPLHRLYARWMVGRVLRKAGAVLSVSEATKRELLERFGGAAERVVAIPNGVDERFFEPVPLAAIEGFLAARQLARGYLLFVGNPLPHKNLQRLLAAYSALRAGTEGVPPLLLAGARGDAQLASLRTLLAGAGLGTSVRVLPHLPARELPALYASARMLLIPSLWEGFGLPAAEAMACGTPVLAADRGGLPEVVGDAGELVDPTSVEAMAGRIGALLRDTGRLEALSRLGRARAQRFRWSETAQRTLEIYRTLLPAPEART